MSRQTCSTVQTDGLTQGTETGEGRGKEGRKVGGKWLKANQQLNDNPAQNTLGHIRPSFPPAVLPSKSDLLALRASTCTAPRASSGYCSHQTYKTLVAGYCACYLTLKFHCSFLFVFIMVLLPFCILDVVIWFRVFAVLMLVSPE